MNWNFDKESMNNEVVASSWLNKSGVYPLVIKKATIEQSSKSSAQAVVIECVTVDGTKAGTYKYWVTKSDGTENKVAKAKVDKIIGVCEIEDKLDQFPKCLENQAFRAVVFVNLNAQNYVDRDIAEVFNQEDMRSAYEMIKGKVAESHDKWVEKLKDAQEVKREQSAKPDGYKEPIVEDEDDYDF